MGDNIKKTSQKCSREIKKWPNQRGDKRSGQFGKPNVTFMRVPERKNRETEARGKLPWRKKKYNKD